ncbi:MAG: type II and III secretion system protein [Verrucomicrobia bacterium]|nr:type II and III secretion system protein [Verrucomicrobiota bacterium]
MKKFSSILLLSTFLIPMAVQATDLVRLAEREEIRRQEKVKQGEHLVVRAERALKDKNLKQAYDDYLKALELIPAGTETATNRQVVLNEFSKTAVDYARSLIARGNYAEAENVAKTVLDPQINPTYKPAAQILSQLEKQNYNTTIDPKFSAKRDEVDKLLNEAAGYFATGRNDLAIKRYEQVLNLDPYNTSARQGMEQVNQQRTGYYNEAYNETRSQMLWLADRAWEKPVRRISKDRSTEGASIGGSASTKDEMMRKLNGIVIDSLSLNDVTIREAVEILKQKSRQLDSFSADSKTKGVNIVLKIPPPAAPVNEGETPEPGSEEPAPPVVTENSRVNLDLKNVPLIEAIRYLTELTGLKQKIEPFAVSLIPATESTEELLVKEYRVSPNFIPSTSPSESEGEPIAGQSSADSNKKLKGVKNATDYLKQQGIPFPTGAFANYVSSGSKLIVRNTQGALDLVDTLVESDVGVKPTQVEIESKFIEISQNNINELGFDWLLGPFSIGGGVYGDGGTPGGDSTANYNNFPFGQVGGNPVTAGNRSGIGTSVNSAITANSLDALVAGIPQGANVASPGIFGLAGVFTNPQFQLVIRALSQQKGVDLMSAPKVTTKSGNSATIKIIREFPFPTEFEPPEVPEGGGGGGAGGGNNDNGGGGGVQVTGGIVTPATPSGFEKRDLGVLLEVSPQVGADNYTIDLSLRPEVVEFDGFINFGSPIVGPRFDPLANPLVNPSGITPYTITENVMNQPVFSVRRVESSVSIWDGQTVAMGGLIREDVQKVDDKVPFLGDIPLAGRLFRSSVDQKIKKNLIIFVTARLLDASGQPLIQDDEAEEIVEPLGVPENLPAPRLEARSAGK